jgi:hypothetical protein
MDSAMSQFGVLPNLTGTGRELRGQKMGRNGDGTKHARDLSRNIKILSIAIKSPEVNMSGACRPGENRKQSTYCHDQYLASPPAVLHPRAHRGWDYGILEIGTCALTASAAWTMRPLQAKHAFDLGPAFVGSLLTIDWLTGYEF